MSTTPTLEFEIVPATAGLELAAKNTLELAFAGFFTEAAKWRDHAATITDPKLARTARLELKNLRVSAEKKRKELKEDSLRMGKAIDGANNILLSLIVPIEKALDDIEKAEERKEAARVLALQEDRAEHLTALEYAPIPSHLGQMSDAEWKEFLQTARDILQLRKERERKAKEEAEALAKAEADAREAQRLENIRLKEEAEKQAAAAKAEREAREKAEAAARAEAEKAEKARRDAEDAARKEREKIEAAAAEERRKALEAAAIAAKEKAAAEAEAQRLRDAEAKRIADEKAAAEAKAKEEAAAAKKAAAAPDKAKLILFADSLRLIEVPAMKSDLAGVIEKGVKERLVGLAAWIESQASML